MAILEEVPVLPAARSPVSDGFDLPFYNGYAVDVAALLAVYALITYFVTLWPTWVCCGKIGSWRSYRKWLMISMLFVELLHVASAFLTLDSYRSRETTFGNRKAPHWALQWTFFTTAITVFAAQGVIAYVIYGVCRVNRLIIYTAAAFIIGPFAWSFYTIFIYNGQLDLASYASFISQTSIIPIIGDAALANLLSFYVLRRKALYNEAFVQVAEFIQSVLYSFIVFRAMPWFLTTLFELPSFGFAASAMKLGGLEVIGNLYPVLLIIAINAYEDASPIDSDEHWKDFRLTIILPAPAHVTVPPQMELV